MDESLFDSSINISAHMGAPLQSNLEVLCNEACAAINKLKAAGPREGYRRRVVMLHDCVMDSPETVFVSRVIPSLASNGVHFGRMISAAVLDPRGFVWGFEIEERAKGETDEAAPAFANKGAGGVWVSLLGPSKTKIPHKIPAVFDAQTAIEKHNKGHPPARSREEWQKLWETDKEKAREIMRSMAVGKDVCNALKNVLEQN